LAAAVTANVDDGSPPKPFRSSDHRRGQAIADHVHRGAAARLFSTVPYKDDPEVEGRVNRASGVAAATSLARKALIRSGRLRSKTRLSYLYRDDFFVVWTLK
jgi:hypothetical protein